MSALTELIAAIAADPDDDAPQMVIADLLQSEGDLRGELIMLDHHERTVGLGDPAAIERYLLLAAEYSFPCARDAEPDMLPFRGDSDPVRYELDHEGRHYVVTYDDDSLIVLVDQHAMLDPEDVVEWWVPCASEASWTAEETRVILTLLGDAIRAGAPLHELRFPQMKDPLPTYDGGPLRGFPLPQAFTAPRGLARNRYGLAARDYHRWHWLWRRLGS